MALAMASGVDPMDIFKSRMSGVYDMVKSLSSGTDMVDNPWPALFGPGKSRVEDVRFDPQRSSTWILPDAYLGTSEYLGQRIENKAWFTDTWYTEVMPIKLTDRLNVSWSTIRFLPNIAEQVPELGAWRIVTSEKLGGEVVLDRKAHGYYMEDGYWRTPEGQVSHFNQLQSIMNACLDTLKLGVLLELRSCDKYVMLAQKRQFMFRGKSIETLFADSKWYWAAFQKYDYPLQQIHSRVTRLMEEFGGRADTYILHPKMQQFLNVGLVDNMRNDSLGPTGVDIALGRQDAATAILSAQLPGKIYVARSYFIDTVNRFVDLLSEQAEIGEYYAMLPRAGAGSESYTTKERSICIYDEDHDRFVAIELVEGIKHTGAFDAEGKPKDYLNSESFTDMNERRSTMLSAEDEARDPLMFRDEKSQTSFLAKFFGQMESEYFTVENKVDWAHSLMNALKVKWGAKEYDEFLQNFTNGQLLLSRLDKQAITPEDFGKYKFDIEDISVAGFPVSIGTYKGAEAIDVADATKGPKNLLPGLGSMTGLDILLTSSRADPNDAVIALKFISAMNKLANALADLTNKSSILINQNFASPWWKEKTPATTLVEAIRPFYPPVIIYEAELKLNKPAANQNFQQTIERDIFREMWRKLGLPDADANTLVGLNAENLIRKLYVAFGTFIQTKENLAKSPYPYTVQNILDEATGDFQRFADEQKAAHELFEKALLQKKADASNYLASLRALEEDIKVRVRQNAEAKETIPDSDKYAILPLLATPEVVKGIVEAIDAGDFRFTVADPDFPLIPIDLARLRKLADQNSDFESEQESIQIGQASFFKSITTRQIAGHLQTESRESRNWGMGMDDFSTDLQTNLTSAHRAISTRIGASSSLPKISFAPRNLDNTEASLIYDAMHKSTFEKNWNDANREITEPFLRLLIQVFNGTRISLPLLNTWSRMNIVIPFGVQIIAPWKRYWTAMAIKCLSGREMGETWVRPGVWKTTRDNVLGAISGNYSFHCKSAVYDQKLVNVIRNLFLMGNVSGNSVKPITLEYLEKMDSTNAYQGESLFYVLVPYTYVPPNAFSLLGSFSNGQLAEYAINENDSPVFLGRLLTTFGLHTRLREYSIFEPIDEGFSPRPSGKNTIVWKGLQLDWNPHAKQYNIVESGKGHMGDNTYLGCDKVRNGELMQFERDPWHGYIKV